LLFKPDAEFSALLTYYHQNDVGYGLQAISPNFGGTVDTPPSQNPFYSPSYPVSFPTGGTVFPHNSTYDTNDSFLLQNKRHTDLVSADVSYDFGFATLSSDTSYYQDGGTDVQDNTGLLTLYPSFYGFLPRMVDYQTDYDHTNGFVQEFRLVSKPGAHVDYVVGKCNGYPDKPTSVRWLVTPAPTRPRWVTSTSSRARRPISGISPALAKSPGTSPMRGRSPAARGNSVRTFR
jgi:hypothetical protein